MFSYLTSNQLLLLPVIQKPISTLQLESMTLQISVHFTQNEHCRKETNKFSSLKPRMMLIYCFHSEQNIQVLIDNLKISVKFRQTVEVLYYNNYHAYIAVTDYTSTQDNFSTSAGRRRK